MALEYRYVSTYGTAKGIAQLISAIGWMVVTLSILSLVMIILASSQAPGNQSFGMFAGMGVISSIGGIISGLLLVITVQFSRASLDSADFNGEMLAIMKANLDARNIGGGQTLPYSTASSLATRPLPSTPANGPTVSEAEPIRVEPRIIEIPPGVENQKLSLREAAQTISVTNSTLQGYIKSGRVTANSDGTIDLHALYRAGFIVRNVPLSRRT